MTSASQERLTRGVNPPLTSEASLEGESGSPLAASLGALPPSSPATEPTSEPESEPASEPASEPVPEPQAEAVADPEPVLVESDAGGANDEVLPDSCRRVAVYELSLIHISEPRDS